MSQSSFPGNTNRQFATFTVEGLLFGIEVLQVQEVLRHQEMTRVPLAPKVVRGLINLRGQIVTAFDMRERLRFPPRTSEQESMNVIVRAEDGAVSLLVDEIGDVLEVGPECYEPVPDTVAADLRSLLEGVYKLDKLDGRLLLILNTGRTLQSQDGN